MAGKVSDMSVNCRESTSV